MMVSNDSYLLQCNNIESLSIIMPQKQTNVFIDWFLLLVISDVHNSDDFSDANEKTVSFSDGHHMLDY